MNKPVYLDSLQSVYSEPKEYTPKDIQTFHKRATLPVSCKIRNDYADYDYIESLDSYALFWLRSFNREYYNADFRHNGKRLHKSKKAKLLCYNENNSRNRDVYAKSKCMHKLLLFGLDSAPFIDILEDVDTLPELWKR